MAAEGSHGRFAWYDLMTTDPQGTVFAPHSTASASASASADA